MGFECVSKTDVGLRRKVNEDALLVRTERGLWAVADGMGGHERGDVASSRVTQSLLELPAIDGLDELVECAVSTLQRVNDDLIELAGAAEGQKSIGSTVVGLAIADGQFRCFWAGDSRAYRLRDNQIVQLSRDHSMVQDLVDAGMLQPEEAEGHPNANIITRAVGVARELRVDMVSGDAMPRDQFLLATDGVTRLLSNAELAAELSTNAPAIAARKLIDTVLARGAPDNASLIIIKIL